MHNRETNFGKVTLAALAPPSSIRLPQGLGVPAEPVDLALHNTCFAAVNLQYAAFLGAAIAIFACTTQFQHKSTIKFQYNSFPVQFACTIQLQLACTIQFQYNSVPTPQQESWPEASASPAGVRRATRSHA